MPFLDYEMTTIFKNSFISILITTYFAFIYDMNYIFCWFLDFTPLY